MINGVEMFELRTHSDERGFFREIFRFSECSDGISVGQMSHSLVNEGVVKAWHGHVSQSQWNYVVNGKIQVVLYDDRNDSSTYGELMEFIVGEENVIGYLFPPGVLHGYKCMVGPMHIVYVTSGVYDLDDEVRVPYEYIEYGKF